MTLVLLISVSAVYYWLERRDTNVGARAIVRSLRNGVDAVCRQVIGHMVCTVITVIEDNLVGRQAACLVLDVPAAVCVRLPF